MHTATDADTQQNRGTRKEEIIHSKSNTDWGQKNDEVQRHSSAKNIPSWERSTSFEGKWILLEWYHKQRSEGFTEGQDSWDVLSAPELRSKALILDHIEDCAVSDKYKGSDV